MSGGSVCSQVQGKNKGHVSPSFEGPPNVSAVTSYLLKPSCMDIEFLL